MLVEFWAPWCTQCRPMANVVERLADELPEDVRVLKLNVEEHGDAAREHSVRSLPSLLYFEGSGEKARIVGFKRLPLVLQELRPHL
ncbi:MAG: thioredoxin domain-containing protein [Chloroflexota bacterium]|nr:thioredoxin domain-containing protein [Chloroflexota bacterium]